MNIDRIEGYIEIVGEIPILITALHGFGSDHYKDIVKLIKSFAYQKIKYFVRYRSAVDKYTWEIAYKVAIAEKTWAILPTLSKVDSIDSIEIPDYNLNKSYARNTPFWNRVRDLLLDRSIRVIIDIHGMKNIRKWPDICISTRGFTTVSRDLIENIVIYLEKIGLRTSIDYPFIGGAFIAEFGRPPQVEAFALEIKRNLRYYGSDIPLVIRNVIRVVKDYIYRNKI